MAEVTISDAGAHPDAVGVKIPAMRGGQKGYVTFAKSKAGIS